MRLAESRVDQVDIAILSALRKPELEKVLSIGGRWHPLTTADDPTSYHETTYTSAKGRKLRVVAAAPTQMGMSASAVLATKMLLRFRPKLVAMVGVAAGAKSDQQNFGDILTPNQTFDYNAGKLTMRGAANFTPHLTRILFGFPNECAIDSTIGVPSASTSTTSADNGQWQLNAPASTST